MTPFAPVLLVAVLLTSPLLAEARLPLTTEPHINEQLIAGAAGDILRNICPTISARMFVVWDKLYMLRQYAVDQGYTETEVKAFLKDPVQKDNRRYKQN